MIAKGIICYMYLRTSISSILNDQEVAALYLPWNHIRLYWESHPIEELSNFLGLLGVSMCKLCCWHCWWPYAWTISDQHWLFQVNIKNTTHLVNQKVVLLKSSGVWVTTISLVLVKLDVEKVFSRVVAKEDELFKNWDLSFMDAYFSRIIERSSEMAAR